MGVRMSQTNKLGDKMRKRTKIKVAADAELQETKAKRRNKHGRHSMARAVE